VRQTNFLFYIFLCLTIFLIVIHIKRTIYFENPSRELIEKVYSGQAIISANIKADKGEYFFNCSFHHIKTAIFVTNLHIKLIKSYEGKESRLVLDKILPYSGMHNWDIPEFKSYATIPDSLKSLNTSSNPYFAYEFYFKDEIKNLGDMFIAELCADFIENGQKKHIEKKMLFPRKSKLEIKPLDVHSDASFILLPISGLITILLSLIKLFVLIRGRKDTKGREA
jgi:hypothetical protein